MNNLAKKVSSFVGTRSAAQGCRLYIFYFLPVLFAACTFNAALQGKGETYLQGQWRQDTSALQKKLVTYSLYNINFACDSFYLCIQTYSKVNYGADTCMNKGHWTEYVKGNYRQKNDTLHLSGQFCDARYNILQKPGCFRSGNYAEDFKVVHKTDSLVQLNGTASIMPFNIRLIKRLTCNQKPI